MTPQLTEIDHVAIAVHDLEAAIDYYQRAFGATVEHREVVESDGVEEALLKVAESYIQLLTPTRDDSPVAKALEKRGEGLHHVGYRVADCGVALDAVVAAGGKAIDAGAPARLAGHDRRVRPSEGLLRHAHRAGPGVGEHMRTGIVAFAENGSLDDLAGQLERAEGAGFDTAWVPQIFGWDTLTALAVAGRATSRIELGTAVVPTYPRHPMMLAAQALTTNAAVGGRLALGIGLSHKVVIDDLLGMSFDKPAVHMRDYLNDPRAPPARAGRQPPGHDDAHPGRALHRHRDGADPAGAGRRHGRPHAPAGWFRGRRHHPLDDGPGHRRDPRRAAHHQGRGRRRPQRTAGGRRPAHPPDQRSRRRRGPRPTTSSRSTARFPRTPPCSTARAPPAPATSPSSATRPRCTAGLQRVKDAGATDFEAAPFGNSRRDRAHHRVPRQPAARLTGLRLVRARPNLTGLVRIWLASVTCAGC